MSVIVKRKPIHFKHPIRVFVPVFQKDFDSNGDLLFHPTFTHNLGDATSDQQMAWSFDPDYVIELNGEFDATTKPLVIEDEECDCQKDGHK